MTMTPLRRRMIEDMSLAGLATRSQAIYVKSVRRLAAHYRRSPDELSEEEVRSYLVKLRDRGAARHLQGRSLRHPVPLPAHPRPRLAAVF
jgi:hypothetical protein